MFIFAFTILLFLTDGGFLVLVRRIFPSSVFCPHLEHVSRDTRVRASPLVVYPFASRTMATILNLSGEQVGLMARSQLCEDPVLPVCLPAVRVLAVCPRYGLLGERASTDLCSKGVRHSVL